MKSEYTFGIGKDEVSIYNPKVTPMGKQGEDYVYRIGKGKKCYIFKRFDRERGTFIFKKLKRCK